MAWSIVWSVLHLEALLRFASLSDDVFWDVVLWSYVVVVCAIVPKDDVGRGPAAVVEAHGFFGCFLWDDEDASVVYNTMLLL